MHFRHVFAVPAVIFVLAAAPSQSMAANASLCSDYGTGKETVLVFIDRTTAGQQAKLKADVASAREFVLGNLKPVTDKHSSQKTLVGSLLKPGQRLDISIITDNVAERRQVFDDCRPGRETGISSYLARPANPVKLHQDEEDFWNEAAAAIERELKTTRSTRKSGIIDTLANVTRNHPRGSIKRVVLVSDLLDNLTVDLMPKNGKVRGMTEAQLQDALRAVAGTRSFSALEGAEVTVFGFGLDDIDRKPLEPAARRMVENFWRTYFQRSGASKVELKY
jgi:hypothetical protein